MIAKVALFSPLKTFFDYKIPEPLKQYTAIGLRVSVPFGTKVLIGIISAITTKSKIPTEKLREIIELIDYEPIIPAEIYNALLWAADYYHSPLGALLHLALPKYVKENKVCTNLAVKADKQSKIADYKENAPLSLNPEQQEIINTIIKNINYFNIITLAGVTGSGKTEVYLRITEFMLQQHKQILILVPEIGLTPQTCNRFTTRFPNIVIAILHSHLSPKQRYLNWLKAKNGEAKIILGTRSAAFVPLLNPGIFIIDEEHDLSFKQQEGIRYSARDFLIMRAKFINCPIVLGSATPSLETIYNVQINKYLYCQLPNRANACLPAINIIDIRHKQLSAGLSNMAISTIQQYLLQKHQVLIFINRRGFAPILICFACKYIKKCPNCDANMNLHIYTNNINCHHCQYSDSIPNICPNCQQHNLSPFGQGTEKVECLFQQLFPNIKIARIDQDSTRNKQKFQNILADILDHKIDLLIGTQMIAKGHHFPKLSLVVIVDADAALFSNDFRATERLAQLMLQVAGRAGREQPGLVLLQTCHPNNKIIQTIANHNYQEVANLLLEERRAANLPPFSYHALWRVDSNNMQTGLKFLTKIKQAASNFNNGSKFFGPIPAIMPKRKKKFHARLLLQHTSRTKLHSLCKYIINILANTKIPSHIKWSIDIDPKESF